MIRLCACLDVPLNIIEPCGFPWNEKKIAQSALDYYSAVSLIRHNDWDAFKTYHKDKRIILMTTRAPKPFHKIEYSADDILLAGRESAGVPEYVHETVQERVIIPLKSGQRSLNIVTASAMVLAESLKQTRWSIEP